MAHEPIFGVDTTHITKKKLYWLVFYNVVTPGATNTRASRNKLQRQQLNAYKAQCKTMGCCAICPERQPDKYVVYREEKDDHITGSNDEHPYAISNPGLIDDTNEKEVKTHKSYSENKLVSDNMQLNETTSGDAANINENERVDSSVETDTTISDRRIDIESGYTSGYSDRLSTEHEKMIQRNYRFLLDNLMAKCITPSLVQKGIFSLDDAIEIQKGLTERGSAEIFLQKLVLSKPTSFENFIEALRETKQEFIVSALERGVNAQEEFPAVWTTGDEANIKRMIEREREYILDQLHPDKILGFFVERGIFNIEIIADMTFKSRKEKAKIVLESVLQNLPYAFNLLLHALRQTESDQLASCLSEMVSNTRDVSTLDRNSYWKDRCYLGCKSKESKVRIQIKATLCSGEDMQPLLEAEKYLVKHINTEECVNLRQTFLKETESVLKETTFGSLIIHITPCSKKAYNRVLKFCQNGSFETLLKNLLSDEKAKQLLPHGPITVNIELRAIGFMDEGATSEVAKFRDRLIEEFDTVVEEINPMNFKRVFVDRRLLSEDYFHQLSRLLLQSRSASAADFVIKVLELGEDAVLAFKETIEKDGPEYLLAALMKESTKIADDPDNDELIATLKVIHQKFTRSDGIIFNDSSFQITIKDSIDLQRTSPTDSATGLNTLGASPVVVIPRKITSDRYGTKQLFISTPNPPRRSSSGFSEFSRFSRWSEADPALDLEGDLSS